MSFLDKTFCASPDCKNECGRKMSEEEQQHRTNLVWKNPESCANLVSWGYFCGEPQPEGIEHD